MNNIKNLVFKLIKNIPDTANSNTVEYFRQIHEYAIGIFKAQEKFQLVVNVYTNIRNYAPRVSTYVVDIDERDYMNLKWQFEEWKQYLENKDLDDFEIFANTENGTMDDLLEDA